MRRNDLLLLDIPPGNLRAFTHLGDRKLRQFFSGDGDSSGGATDTGPGGTNVADEGQSFGAVYGGGFDYSGQGVEGPGQGGAGIDPNVGPSFGTSSVGLPGQELGENVPTGITSWDTSLSAATPTQDLYDKVLSGTATRTDLQVLSNRGFGDQPGNPRNPDQTIDQRIAADRLHSGLNTVAPYIINAIPGVGTALTAARVIQNGPGALLNPFGNIDMIRDAIELNRQEQEFGALAPAPSVAEGMGGTGGSSFDFFGDSGTGGDSTPTPTVSPSLATTPGGIAGMSGLGGSLPGGRQYANTPGIWGSPGVAGMAGGFGGRPEDEEDQTLQRAGMANSSMFKFAEGGMVGPGGMPMVGGAPRAGLQPQPAAAPMNPQMAGMQAQQFAQQNPQQVAQIRQEIMEGLQSGELQPQTLNMIVQLAQVVAQNPDMYPYARNFLIQQDIMDEADLPQQYSPAVAFLMNLVAEAARGVSGSAPAAAGTAPPVASMAKGGTVPNSKKPSGGVVIEAHEGEYVIPAHIVRQKGTDFFDKLIGKDVKAERSAA